ncbi:MAG TPA: LuxR C-terminal-related transcriptional regulator [Kofleriaceae bacterium]|nr:LuxR C-terminal-related transcriptional regulator [Kofleriaceae bacterium]
MNATHERSGLASNLAIALALAMLVALLLVDLVGELAAGTTAFHAIVEGSAIVTGATTVGAIVRQMRELGREARVLRARLASSSAEAERWAREAQNLIAGLAGAIDDQLERWHLTAAEKEIALLLLKGLEHKQIAELRGVSETTVRQQARSLYRKAGLAGRHELAAFFLEDLLGPRAAGDPFRG